MKPINSNDLKKEVRELIAGGEDPYSVALFGITTKYLLESQTKIDFGFFELLDEVDVIAGSPSSFEGDEGPYLELLAFYYLIARNTLTFSQGVNWMTHLSPDQRQVILSWPKNYVLSVFDLIIKDDLVLHKDLKTGKEYLMDYSPEDIGLPEDKLNIRLLTIIVPTEKNYLSAMPIFLPLDDLSLAKIKRSPSKQEYELALLIECSNFLDAQAEDNWENEEFLPEDVGFYPANRKFGESDKDFARRLLLQSKFFQDFPYHTHAEALMIKVVQTFPQLFFSTSNAHALLEAVEILFTKAKFNKMDFELMSDELAFFWCLLIKEHLPREVEALAPYLVPDKFDDQPF
ncbi:hypothetical protein [Enterococcus sp. AZ072]|uniref:hypothetical protein n=1 Tax=unclassified Enterococcus TaxID=2608891 RepID=UPI003D282F77